MKAIVCHAPEDLRLDTFDTDALGTHQLQVDVAYGGICGSDLPLRPMPVLPKRPAQPLLGHALLWKCHALSTCARRVSSILGD